MELTGFLPIAKRWWWMLLLATLIAGITGYYVANSLEETYEAKTSMLVGPVNGPTEVIRAAGQLSLSYAEIAASQSVLQEAARRLGPTVTVGQLRGKIRAQGNDVTRILTIRARNEDPALAARIANTVAEELEARADEAPLALPPTSASPTTTRPGFVPTIVTPGLEGQLTVIEAAEAPSNPIAPQVELIVLLAALAGLLGALGVLVAIDRFSDSVRSANDLSRLTIADFLGTIPAPKGATTALVVEGEPGSRAAAAFRLLATEIEVADSERPLRSILVTGAREADGTGTLAANLAAVLASSGRRVALVDATGAHGEATALLGLRPRQGLAAAVERGEDVALEFVPLRRAHGVSVVPADPSPGGELVKVEQARQLLHRLHLKVDIVVVNAPPVNRSASTLIWARTTDAAVLAVQRDEATRDDVVSSIETLRLVGANLLGTVLDEHPPLRRRSGGDAPGPVVPAGSATASAAQVPTPPPAATPVPTPPPPAPAAPAPAAPAPAAPAPAAPTAAAPSPPAPATGAPATGTAPEVGPPPSPEPSSPSAAGTTTSTPATSPATVAPSTPAPAPPATAPPAPAPAPSTSPFGSSPVGDRPVGGAPQP